jgi:hypothetical protein
MSDNGASATASVQVAGFDTVLDAERTSEQALRESRAEANRIRQAATAEERRIAARTGERLQKLHTANQKQMADTRRVLTEAFENERQSLAATPDPDEIAAAAERLARILAGIDVA